MLLHYDQLHEIYGRYLSTGVFAEGTMPNLDEGLPVKNGRNRGEGREASQGLHVEWVMNVVAS